MRTQLLCTFTFSNVLHKTVDQIIKTYEIVYDKIFVLENEENKKELMCTYNVEESANITMMENTISFHRKKQTNTLYTINALNRLIETINNGVLDTNYPITWENYNNCMLTTNGNELKKIPTKIREIVHIKTKD
tara:strand:+ start:1425 stop:1826 length:402 start_codon:yes stop_codon:yes gene_type:complete